MPQSFTLPAMPLGLPEAVVLLWLKRPGQSFARGEPLLIVANGAVEVALPAPFDGVLDACLVDQGEKAPVGAVIARYAPAAGAATESSEPAPPGQRLSRCSPAARRIADALHVDVTLLAGSGPSGRIVKRDVLAAADRRPTTDDQPIAHDFGAMSSVFPSSLLLVSPSPCHPVTQALTALGADFSAVRTFCQRHAAAFARLGLPLDSTACVALAVAGQLLRHRLLRARWSDDGLVVRRRVNLAIEPSDGRAMCLVPDAQDLNLRGIARALARPERAPFHATNGATFALLAHRGGSVWSGVPVVGLPTLAVGAIHPRPVVISEAGVDRVAIRPVALLALAYDARVLDQPQADAFLCDLRRALERFSGP